MKEGSSSVEIKSKGIERTGQERMTVAVAKLVLRSSAGAIKPQETLPTGRQPQRLRQLPRHRLLLWKFRQARQPAFAVVAVAAAHSVLTLPAEAVPA